MSELPPRNRSRIRRILVGLPNLGIGQSATACRCQCLVVAPGAPVPNSITRAVGSVRIVIVGESAFLDQSGLDKVVAFPTFSQALIHELKDLAAFRRR
jgi:hypothetical protein